MKRSELKTIVRLVKEQMKNEGTLFGNILSNEKMNINLLQLFNTIKDQCEEYMSEKECTLVANNILSKFYHK